MEQEELKRKLLGLWEKTTHNSKELLSLLFEYYFDIKYMEYKEHDGKIISALCGIPFTFGFGENNLKGIYLISLSSEEGLRKKGILSELLSNFNERLKNEFDFSFLRPQTELLADYYGTQGYLSSFYILEERFTPLHDFRNDYMLSISESDDRIKKLKEVLFDQIKVEEYAEGGSISSTDIISYIKEIEKEGSTLVNLCHNDKDLDYILNPASIRHLMTFVAKDSENKITGLAFTQKEELKRIRIVATYISDMCSYYTILDHIKHKFPEYSISINISDPKYYTNSIMQYTYVAANPLGGDLDNTFGSIDIPVNFNRLLHPMGMVKILRYDKILEYLAKSRSDVDFSLYIRDLAKNTNSVLKNEIKDNNDKEKQEIGYLDGKGEEEEEKMIFVVKNGKCNKELLSNQKNRSVLNLTSKEVSELLLRKNDSSNLIMEAFGIPRLDLQMKLLPC